MATVLEQGVNGRRGVAAEAMDEALTMGLSLAIVLLSVLVGFGGDGERAEELRLLWGTALGLVLAHYFAVRLTAVFARSTPRPTRQDAAAGAAMLGAAIAVTGAASVPYLFDISPLQASTVASLLLLALIGATGFISVRRAGGELHRALAFALIVLGLASVVVAGKYQLAH